MKPTAPAATSSRLPPGIPPDRPVLIAGPTASGKSTLALDFARREGGIIINADALQVYSNWRILTARPSRTDEAAVPHALFGHVAPDAPYSVGHWLRDLGPLLSLGLRPIIVGGSGLYLSALTTGLSEIPPIPAEVRTEANRRRRDSGIATLLAELDAATIARIDRQNPARVQRAWEVLRATGRGLADWQDQAARPLLPRSQAAAFVITAPPDLLNPRIEARFDAMLAAGALDEVRANLAEWDPARPASRAIGATELVAYLLGEKTLDAARAAAIGCTRQYAKRQRTWFRARMRDWVPLAVVS